MLRARKSDSALSASAPIGSPQTSTVPLVGASMQPMRLSSVVLPLPEGPTTMEKRWRGMSRLMPFSAATSTVPVR